MYVMDKISEIYTIPGEYNHNTRSSVSLCCFVKDYLITMLPSFKDIGSEPALHCGCRNTRNAGNIVYFLILEIEED